MRQSGFLLGMLVCSAWAAPLAAGSVTGAMEVSLRVEESCHLDVRPLVFGTAPASAPQRVGEATMAVACSPDTPYVVTLDDGQHGTAGQRRMADASGTQFVAYDIFSDAALTRRWGASPAAALAATAPPGGTVTHTAYARVLAPSAGAGSYQDVVTVTVSF